MTECLICFDDINVYKYHVRCLNCKQIFHSSCYSHWHNLQNQLFCKCVHCQKVGLQCTTIKIKPKSIKERLLRWWLKL